MWPFKKKIQSGYSYHKDAWIIACYFNPMKNAYRKKAFEIWYNSIKHLNHLIVECDVKNIVVLKV